MADLSEHKLRSASNFFLSALTSLSVQNCDLRNLETQSTLQNPMKIGPFGCERGYSAHKQVILNTDQSQGSAINCSD